MKNNEFKLPAIPKIEGWETRYIGKGKFGITNFLSFNENDIQSGWTIGKYSTGKHACHYVELTPVITHTQRELQMIIDQKTTEIEKLKMIRDSMIKQYNESLPEIKIYETRN